MRAREFITESTEREIAQIQYMQGECAVLALTIRNMNPQRFTLGFVYEFFDSSPDMYLEPDEFDELDPARQQEIRYNHENWTLTHAYVYDVLTREYIDAEGRHKQLPMIGRDFNSTRHNKFPAETQDLVNVSHHMEYDEAQEKWIVLQGWAALDKAYTPEDKQRAREYAIKYLGIDRPAQAVAEGVNSYLWHGSKSEHDILYPQQANDTGGAEGSNKNAVYATPSAKVAIAMGLTTPGSDTGMFPNDPQMVLFKGGIRKGQMIYLHKVPKDLFIKHNSREWFSKPDVKEITPIEVVAVPVDKYLNLIRKATPADLELRKKYMKQEQGVAENFADGRHPEDKGDAKRHGINTKASVSSLRKTAKQGGRKGQLAHWLANMKAGRAKKKKTNETTIGHLQFPRLTIAIDDHAVDRTRTRGINPHAIDQSLKKLNGIADQLAQVEPNAQVWAYDPETQLGLGMRRISSQNMLFKLKTVVNSRPFDGPIPIIDLS